MENCGERVRPRERRLSEWCLETNSTLWLFPQGFPLCFYCWSHYLKKSQGTTTFADIVDDHSDSSSEDDEEDESDEDGGIEEVEEEGDVNWLYILFELYFFPNKTVPSWCFLLSLLLSFWSSAEWWVVLVLHCHRCSLAQTFSCSQWSSRYLD